MIEKEISDLEKLDVYDINYDNELKKLLNNLDLMTNDQLLRTKKILMKKINYDSNIFFDTIERQKK